MEGGRGGGGFTPDNKYVVNERKYVGKVQKCSLMFSSSVLFFFFTK